jgi:hypothetical protein
LRGYTVVAIALTAAAITSAALLIAWFVMPRSSGPYASTSCEVMGGMVGYDSQTARSLSNEDAREVVGSYLASLENPDLVVGEFEEYSNNFYVSIVEKDTGKGAFEIIIDRHSGTVRLEPQSMMWNWRYHMMRHYARSVGEDITSEEALEVAQGFLNRAYPGTRADEIVSYYGYYTIMSTLNGEHFGMLSVNSYTGDVWYHTWHGTFISEVSAE